MKHYYIFLGLLLVLAMALTYKYTLTHEEPYHPAYRVKDCFTFKNSLDNRVDGVVKVLHEYEYTVLWFKEADRRYAGPKMGARIGMKWLDAQTYQVPCVDGW